MVRIISVLSHLMISPNPWSDWQGFSWCYVSQDTSWKSSSSSSWGTVLSQQTLPRPLSVLKDKAAAFISSCQQPPFPTLLLQTDCLVHYKEGFCIVCALFTWGVAAPKSIWLLPSFLFDCSPLAETHLSVFPLLTTFPFAKHMSSLAYCFIRGMECLQGLATLLMPKTQQLHATLYPKRVLFCFTL